MNIKQEYTIKDISDLLKIDKQKISRYIRTNNIKPIRKDSQTFIYDEKTKNLIVEQFKEEEKKEPVKEPVNEPVQKSVKLNQIEIDNSILIEKNNNLKKIIDMLENEKKELQKDKENNQIIIERLTILLSNEQKNNSLLPPEKDNDHPKETETETKKSFWQRLFNK